MITMGPFCPCNTYTHIQHWELLEKSTMPMVTPCGECQRKWAKLNLDKYIIRAAEVKSWLIAKMPVEHRRDSSGTLLFMKQKQKVIFQLS